jgi:thiamine pyrophosphokinase
MSKNKSRAVIVADGSFPIHNIPLGYLRNAGKIICCDGSASTLVEAGFIPDAIVGDMDSLDRELAARFSDRIHVNPEQETNDLTKSVNWCIDNGFDDLVILGATGKREDHTLGNISLLAEYVKNVRVKMVTDTGYLIPLISSATLPCCKGQQVSIFSIDNETEITSSGLKFPLNGTKLKNWWQATLNECLGDSFSLEFSRGRLIVYMKFL